MMIAQHFNRDFIKVIITYKETNEVTQFGQNVELNSIINGCRNCEKSFKPIYYQEIKKI